MMREVCRLREGWRIAKLAKIWIVPGQAAAGGYKPVPGSEMGTRGRGEVPPRVKAACNKG